MQQNSNVGVRNNLWHQLLTEKALKDGWHLARSDIRGDFIEEVLALDIYAARLDSKIQEILRKLKVRAHRPRPILEIDVPKSDLATRPGAVLSLEDRILMLAIIKLIAPKIDAKLPDSIYSYRLKRDYHKSKHRKSIFEETDIYSLPFLKRKTLHKYMIDPFDAWYKAWPKFDSASKRAFQEEGFNFLAVTDISAYFENIQIQILIDFLKEIFPDEPKIVNKIDHIISSWVIETSEGYFPKRGIPQGSLVGSFFGNAFLFQLDTKISEFELINSNRVKYFRYMDDIRLFSKSYELARRGILLIERELRHLHLNVQTAKTRILDEGEGEISKELIDDRIDELKNLIDFIQERMTPKDRPNIKKKLHDIARKDPGAGKQKIIGTKKPLKGLSLRAFRLWLTANGLIGDYRYVDRLFLEIGKNPEYRLTRRIIASCRSNPKINRAGLRIYDFISKRNDLFPHQVGELLRGARYLARPQVELRDLAIALIQRPDAGFYERSQAALLLNRFELLRAERELVYNLFLNETHRVVLISFVFLLSQGTRSDRINFLDLLSKSENDSLLSIYNYIRGGMTNFSKTKFIYKNIFGSSQSNRPNYILCDYIGVLNFVACSENSSICQFWHDRLKLIFRQHSIIGLRKKLSSLVREFEHGFNP